VRRKSRLKRDFFTKEVTKKPTKFRQKQTIFTIPIYGSGKVTKPLTPYINCTTALAYIINGWFKRAINFWFTKMVASRDWDNISRAAQRALLIFMQSGSQTWRAVN
jgi:hypothetical protein